VVIWTANAFALLGLGSLLALVDILVRRFRYLGKTIALILAFVGIKILTDDLVHIGDLGSLAIIAALLAGGILTSMAVDRLDAAPRGGGEPTSAPLPGAARVPGSPGDHPHTGVRGMRQAPRFAASVLAARDAPRGAARTRPGAGRPQR
jgi:tellurite resistance protein TerC